MVLPLRQLLEYETLDLDVLQNVLKSFSCARDYDVQNFLHSKAIDFEKTNKARTYLILDNNMDKLILRGYFSLALKVFEFSSQNSKECKSDMQKGSNVSKPAYLIGQLAKNDGLNEHKVCDEFLTYAFEKIKMAQNYVAGKIVYLDCKNELIKLYEKVGFKKATDEIDTNGFIQMYKII